ncbi:hypothetical protein ACHAW6_013826 [Cyclotella cf. meneghiniana]
MPVATAHKQPAMDTRVYEVRFPDCRAKELAVNTIAEALYAQCDPDGNQYIMLDAIVDYRKNPDVAISWNNQVKIVNAVLSLKDSSTSWQKLADLKESHPLQFAEFALPAGIANEPAFNWWVSCVLKKRDPIISLVKHRSTRYHKWTHKFKIELPKMWMRIMQSSRPLRDAIKLEMKNVRVAFDVLPDGVVSPSDHQYMKCHMIFDVKMEDFHRKAWLVAGGHMTKAPAILTYARIVSQETVCISLLVTALKDIDIWATDVLNAYITAPCRKKIWTTLGKEFGDDCGRKAIIVQALYGLKSSGAAFRAHLPSVFARWSTARALLTLTCGSRNRQTGRAIIIMPISSDILMTYLWSTITQEVSWTRLTSSFPSSLIRLVPLRCISGRSSRRRPSKMELWHGD